MKVKQVLHVKNFNDIEGHKEYIDHEAAKVGVTTEHSTLIGKDYYKLETIFNDGCENTKDQEVRRGC